MRRAAALRAAALLVALALLGGAAAQAVVPEPPPGDAAALRELVAGHPVWGPALAFRSAARAAAERAAVDADADLRRAGHGLSAALAWRPSVGWRGTGDAPLDLGDAAWSSDLTATFGWRADAQALVRARIAALRAAIALAERTNRDLRDAVGRHVELQRAHVALTLAEDAAATRAATLAQAERVDLERMTPDGAEPRTLIASRLEAERAAVAVERAARDVAGAERRAEAAGFSPRVAADVHRDRFAPAPLEGWRLYLPAADPLDTPTVVRAALDLAAAEATARRATVGGLLDDVRIEATRVERDARLRASVRLDEARPAASLELSLRPAARPSWSLALSAVLRIDDATLRAADRALADVAAAAAAWAEAADEAAWRLEATRRTALDAEEDVAFAERALSLARLALLDAIDAWRDAERAQPADAERADAALARVAVAFERERDAFYRSWNRYLLEAERYWSEAGVVGGVLAPP